MWRSKRSRNMETRNEEIWEHGDLEEHGEIDHLLIYFSPTFID
jgi:hypothetical protein